MLTTEKMKRLYLTSTPEKPIIDTIEMRYPNNIATWRLCLYGEKITKKIEDGSFVDFEPLNNFKVGFPAEDEHLNFAFPVVLDASDASVYEELENYLGQSNIAIDYIYRGYLEEEDEPQATSSDTPFKLYNPTLDFENNTLTLKGSLPDFTNQTLSALKYNKVDFPSLEYLYV